MRTLRLAFDLPGGRRNGRAPPVVLDSIAGFKSADAVTEIGELNPRATVRGELFSVGYVKDGVPLKMTLKQGTNTAHIQVIATAQSDGSPTVAVPAMKGMKVLLKDAVFTVNWKGEIVLKMDPFSSLVADDDDGVESSDLFDFQAKHNKYAPDYRMFK